MIELPTVIWGNGWGGLTTRTSRSGTLLGSTSIDTQLKTLRAASERTLICSRR
jgi:hypothetical protein